MLKTRRPFQVTVAIFDAFYHKVLKNGALPIIVIYPDSQDRRRGRLKKPRRYQPLLEYFTVKGYRYIDLLTAFEPFRHQYRSKEFMVAWGHFSPLAHKISAQYINAYMRKETLTDLLEITRAIQAESQKGDR